MVTNTAQSERDNYQYIEALEVAVNDRGIEGMKVSEAAEHLNREASDYLPIERPLFVLEVMEKRSIGCELHHDACAWLQSSSMDLTHKSENI